MKLYARGAGYLSPAQVARLFGAESHVPFTWARRGWIDLERVALPGHRRRAWRVPEQSVARHIVERPWSYWPHALGTGHQLTRLARLIARRERWLPLREAAALVHYSPTALKRFAARHDLPHQRRPRCGDRHGGKPVLVFQERALRDWIAWWQGRPDYCRRPQR